MFNRSTFLLKLIAGLAMFSWPAVASAQQYFAYVAAESEDEVAVVSFDGEKAETVQRIPVGTFVTEIEGPHGLTVSPDGKYWYLSLAHGNPNGWLLKYQTEDNKLVGSVELGLFPATMQISKATGFLYVVNFNLHGKMVPSTVSIVDPVSMSELTRVETGVMPHGSRISPDGTKHYSLAMMSGELFEIDAMSMQVSRSLNLDTGKPGKGSMKMKMGGGDSSGMSGDMDGAMTNSGHGMHSEHKEKGGMMMHSKVKPTWVIPHPTDNKLYVAGNGNAKVYEVDSKKWEISRSFDVSKGPYNVEVTPDGTKFVVTYKGAASTGVWDIATGTELAKIDNSQSVPHGIAITPDSRYAFVSVEGIGGQPGKVDVIDLEKLTLAGSTDIGKQAGGIVFWKMETAN